jgi:hypothetical protein
MTEIEFKKVARSPEKKLYLVGSENKIIKKIGRNDDDIISIREELE